MLIVFYRFAQRGAAILRAGGCAVRVNRSKRLRWDRMHARTEAMRAEALERVLAVLDEVPETLTVRLARRLMTYFAAPKQADPAEAFPDLT